ncbi:MAG: 2-dehydropantoate 2-reductase [Planctomycetota bacterium]
MRVLIVGAGALGGMVGASLTAAGEDVLLVENNVARARLLAESGLFLAEGNADERCIPIRVVTSLQDVDPVDLVFIAVKSYQTDGAARAAMPVLHDDTMVLSMQNGIGNAETIADLVGAHRVVTGITYHSVQHVGPNRLRFRKGIKPIQIAPLDGQIRPVMQQIGEVFGRAGLETEVHASIDATIWQKLLHNAVINPVSALTGLTCHELLGDPDMQAFMRELCMEIVSVMRWRGIPIVNEEDPYQPLIGSQKALGKNRPSMWQDLSRSMRTEIDAINGAIVREAERYHLHVPHNRALVHFAHSRERQKFMRRQEREKELQQASSESDRPPTAAVRSTGVEPDGGMPEGRVTLRCAPQLRGMIGDYYRRLVAARDSGQKVAWVTGTGPVELFRALGLAVYFPENHAALIGATRQAGTYITRAMAEGFSPFAHSGMTSDIGALLAGESPLRTAHGVDGPPRPDVAVYCTNFGASQARWFEWAGDHFNVPVLGLHPPAGLDRIEHEDLDAATRQMLLLARRLEPITGPLDMDRLSQVVELSSQAAELWRQILDLACTVPSPLTFFDVLVHMAPFVMMRGTPEAVEYYRLLKDELEERVAAGQAAVPGERFRFYWEGPPIWCALRPLARLFMEHRVAVVASTYGSVFAFEGLDATNPIESLARASISILPNRSDRRKAGALQSWFDRFGVDGVIYHDDRTSPELSNVRYGLAKRLTRATGLPSLVIEADAHDPRLFSMDQVARQLAQLVERANEHEQRSGLLTVGGEPGASQ